MSKINVGTVFAWVSFGLLIALSLVPMGLMMARQIDNSPAEIAEAFKNSPIASYKDFIQERKSNGEGFLFTNTDWWILAVFSIIGAVFISVLVNQVVKFQFNKKQGKEQTGKLVNALKGLRGVE